MAEWVTRIIDGWPPVADGQLFALSAAFSTLLTIDLTKRQVVAAHALSGLTRPTGIAIKGNDLYIVDDAGMLTVVARPPTRSDIGRQTRQRLSCSGKGPCAWK